MRRPRRWRPGTKWSITVRCVRTEFRFAPTEERTGLIGYWLAKALEACPGIRLLAVTQMSNHLHLEVEDTQSESSEFMARFLGPLSKDINYLDGVRGQLFERRFTAIEIIDAEAVADRIAYTVLNPVRAHLVKRHSDWSGLCHWAGNTEGPVTFRRFRRRAYDRACYLNPGQVDPKDFYSSATLKLAHAADEHDVKRRIEETEAAAVDQPVLGMEKAEQASPFDHPPKSKRGRMPVCHASTLDLWKSFLSGWREFVRAYRAASRAYRAGDIYAAFPDWTFRPAMPAAV